ncbi:hypothetical protein HZI73_02695 [Vallitalea pronyensis]|uniref:PKD/Chitinase domain-containing protein n=1 Tax=Vallitalea pronyensis TaxID=1348613 RepID=A0A8J8MGN7_9FIRM|nr:hypothetical protein [Vallitalea pronyensis]QUI21255.1 hypothetical protein HZI73_02695 [Vallitalea pronyensis]
MLKASSNRILCLFIILCLTMNSFTNVFAVDTGGSNADIVDNKNGIPVFRFYVSATASNAKYKYKTIGWKLKFTPEGKSEPAVGTMPYTFESVSQNRVDIKLEDIFDRTNLPDEDKMRGGKIEIDAIQIITIYGVPMAYDKKTVDTNAIMGWENDTQILMDSHDNTSLGNRRVQLFTNDASGIINGLPHGISWGDTTKNKDLPNYYNKTYDYPPLIDKASFNIDLDLEVMSSIDDHTIDMSKGEGSAQVRIHAKADIKNITSIYTEYLNNPSNIRFMNITIEEQTSKKKLTKTITNLTSLSGTADFTFDYVPNDIEDGDSDLDDSVTKDYTCEVEVRYLYHYRGYGSGSTSAELIKKAPIPDGDPLAILSVPDQVLVDEEILADGSGSIAPKGATLVNYSWEVESEPLPKEEGNKSITLTYDEPKTVTVALTVEDSNGKTDTTMKDVKVIKKASPPHNWSPDVTLSAPSIVMQGDSFTLRVDATDKEDGPLTPTLSKPSSLVLSSAVHNGDNTSKFMQSGIFTVTAKATDSGGKSDSASTQIEVCPPKPLAIISEDGDYKVGQTVVLDSSNSKAVSKTYPIDWTLTNWTITPLDSLTSDDIYTKKLNSKEIAFTSKKSGKVEIALTVTNTLGYSNTRTIERTILADTPPIADFTLIKKVYRDKDNDKKATVKAFDASTSPDGDSITKRAWFYAFDSDNDGIFSDDTWYYHNGTSWVDSGTAYSNLFTFADTVDTGNLTDVTVESTHVGRYKFELKVYEEHDNRLLEFVDTSYILTDDTADKPGEECIAEIDNIAPVTAVKVDVSKDEVYDIVVVTDYKDMDLITLQTELNLLKAEAFANNKDFNIYMVTDTKKTGQQHKVRNYYTYARNIYLSYYLESGSYQQSISNGGDFTDYYNNDYRSSTIQYETTQGYTTPTIPFQKGNTVSWERGSFYRSDSNMYGGYEQSGVEFRFFNPDNKIATLSTRQITTNGWYQGIGFCQIWGNIRIGGESVNVTNHWTRTSSFSPHDFYYDIQGMDFSKVEDVPYTKDSKKVFLYFTKGIGLNYENEAYNYSASSIDKDLMDYLIYNDFETYVIAPDETTLDKKFDSNNHSSDISSQYATLRELAHCSTTRGKYIIGDVSSDLWKDQLMLTVRKHVVMPNNVSIDNNVMRLTFDDDFTEGQELDLTLLQQEFKISDLVGNTLELPKMEYDIKVEDKGIKPLSSLYFSNPLPQHLLKDDIQIIKRTKELIIYKKDGQLNVSITDESLATTKFTADGVRAIKDMDYTNVKDIHTISNLLVMLYNDGTIKAYGDVYITSYISYKIDTTKWRNIKQLISLNNLLIGIKHDGNYIMIGTYRQYSSTYHRNNYEEITSDTYYEGHVVAQSIMLLYRSGHNGKTYHRLFGNHITFYPYRIEELYHTTNYEVICNTLDYTIYVQLNGKYYRVVSNYDNHLESLDELNGMSIKRLIPVGYRGFVAVKSDDTLYFSKAVKDTYATAGGYYYEVWTKMNSLGKLKNVVQIENGLWLQGTNGEFFFGDRVADDTYTARYLKIDDISHIITNNLGMIVIMKDGKRYDMNQYVNAYKVPNNAIYYFEDSRGVAYMTSNGYFNSSLVPSYNSHSWYNWRKISSYFDKVINLGFRVMIGIKNGRASVYKEDNSDYNYLNNATYYSGIKDILISNGIPLLIRENNYINPIYKNSLSQNLNGYSEFRNNNISKFAACSKYLYGIDTNGDLWRTDPSGLILLATDVEDMFPLDTTLVYLKKDGTLSNYGDGKQYETYEGMLIAPDFITLQLKGTTQKACITTSGVQLDYIGGFSDMVETIQPLQSTQFHIGNHLDDGVAYKYKVFSDDKTSVEEILVNQLMDDTWTDVQDLDIVPVQDGYYIGVVEVNAENRAIRYSYMKAKAENL